MNLIIEPLHKEEADKLMLVLSISFASLLEQNIYSRSEVADYIIRQFPASELRKLDDNIQSVFRFLGGNKSQSGTDFAVNIKNLYSDSLRILKEYPFWTDESEAWVFYAEETSGKSDVFMNLRFEGTAESVKIVCLIGLGLAHALKNKALSIDDAEILLFKPSLLDLFENVDRDAAEIIDRGTGLEDVDAFESLDIHREIQYILNHSQDKLREILAQNIRS
jgi:hypothetical protein